MRTNDERLAALIRAALAVSQLGSDLSTAGLSEQGAHAIDALDAAIGDLDAHDMVMAGMPASGIASEPCGEHGEDVLDLDCPDCDARPMLGVLRGTR